MINKLFGKAPVVRSIETGVALGSLGYVMYAEYSAPSSGGLGGFSSLGAAYLWLLFFLVTAGAVNGEIAMRGVRRALKTHFFFGGGLLVIAGLLSAWNALHVEPPTIFFAGMVIGAGFFLMALIEKHLGMANNAPEIGSKLVTTCPESQIIVAQESSVRPVVAVASAPEVVSAPTPAPVVPLERPVLSAENTVVKTAKVEIEVLGEAGAFTVQVVSNGLTATQLDRQDGLFKRVQRLDGVEFVRYKNFQQGVKQLTLHAVGDREQLIAALQALVDSDPRFS